MRLNVSHNHILLQFVKPDRHIMTDLPKGGGDHLLLTLGQRKLQLREPRLAMLESSRTKPQAQSPTQNLAAETGV